MSAVFTAQYRGACGVCEEEIDPGDRVKFEDGDLIHAGCAGRPSNVTQLRPAAEVCDRCFIIRPCPCDDGQGDAA